MRATTMFYDRTLFRRPRTLFAIGLAILSLTLLLSYERITSSAFSLFQGPAFDVSPDGSLSAQDLEAYQSVFDEFAPMSYGTSVRPPLKAMPSVLVSDLPEQYVPSVGDSTSDDGPPAKRLIITGDVHGQKQALEDLLAKLDFNKKKGDHLVFTGDLINKGPDSAGVVALAMKHGAHSVRGNHEDRVLLAHAAITAKGPLPAATPDADVTAEALAQFHIKENSSAEDGDPQDPQEAIDQYQAIEATLSKGDKRDRETARSLSPEQIEWLSELPVILRVGPIPLGAVEGNTTFENVLVCHAGLVPNISLADQDPWAVMNMRTLIYPADDARREAVRKHLKEKAKQRLLGGFRGVVAAEQSVDEAMVDTELAKVLKAQGHEDHVGDVALPSSGRDGTYWYEAWSKFQEKVVKRAEKDRKKGRETGDLPLATTVVYGHDAKSGMKVPKEFGRGKKGYTFGLDSGCVYGKSLTALVIEVKEGEAVYEIVQVDCEKGVDHDE